MKRNLLVALCLVFALTLTAIGTQPSAAQAKKIVVGLVQLGTDNPFWIAQVEGGQEAARRHGFDLVVTSGQGDVTKQVAAFEDLINKKVDVISINPLDTKAFGPAMEKAKAAKIPVVCLFSPLDGCVTTLGFDETYTSRTIGEFAVQTLTKKYGSPKGNVAILLGLLGQSITDPRSKGFEDVMAQYPNIKILAKEPTNNWDPKRAAEITDNWLTAYPDLDAIYGESDSLTVPAANVIKRAGKSDKILIFSVDGTQPGLDAVKAGLLANTFAYAPQYNGYWNAYAAYLTATGVKLPSSLLGQGALVTGVNLDAMIQMAKDQHDSIQSFPFEVPFPMVVSSYEAAAKKS
jgi:ribose transport system substrate-binding protein